MNEFLARRHAEPAGLADAIERFRDHRFEDEEAGEDYRELLDELERLRALERFLARAGPPLPRHRGGRLRDGPADPRAHRGARAARARPRRGELRGDRRPSSCASCSPSRGRSILIAARPRARRCGAPATCASAATARADAARDPADRRAGARRGLRRAAQGPPRRPRDRRPGRGAAAARRDAALRVRRPARPRRAAHAAERAAAPIALPSRPGGRCCASRTSSCASSTTRPTPPPCCCST